MKRFFLFFLSAVLMISLLFTGCSSENEPSREDDLKKSLEYTYEELTSTFSGAIGQYDLVAEYLKAWANKNEIQIAVEDETYMVMTNPATEGCEKMETIVLQCAIETNNFSNSLQSLSIALTSLLGPEFHGQISLIVTENYNGEFTGAAAVDPKYYQADHFINMQHSDDVQLFTSGALAASGTMTSDISMTTPSYSHAYAITMSTAGHHDSFDFAGNHYPNPVEIIGSLLATEKSSGQLFELASFECESTAGYTPTSATAIVVIDGNDVENFNKKFRSSYNNMKNRFEKLEDNFVFTFTETAMPAQVMAGESSDNIISLMYTLKTGIYLQDEKSGDVLAASDISHVTTLDNKFKLTMVYRSAEQSVLDEMTNVFLTTSGLCDIEFKSADSHMTWPTKNNKKLAGYFSDALGSENSIFDMTLGSSECDIFASKTKLNAISYRCNINHGEAALMNLLHFMESLTQ